MTVEVAVTGVGVVSPFGDTPMALWDALARRVDARAPWQAAAVAHPCAQAIPVTASGREHTRHRAWQLARLALDKAMASDRVPAAQARIGCILGTTTAGIDALERDLLLGGEAGDGDAVGALLDGRPWGAGASVLSAACASGLLAPALAVDRLALGEAEVMFAGGVDVLLDYTLSGFHGLRLSGTAACRPFDRLRQSVVLSEGAAVLRLEPLRSARARGAGVLGVIKGFGMGCDAGHATAPDATGIARTIRAALDDAQMDPAAVACVFAHGTGTPANDAAEAAALAQVFGAQRIPPVAAVKSVLGHSQAAAGTFSLLSALLALRRGVLPPVANTSEVDPAMGNLVLAAPDTPSGAVALVNAFGFGGTNGVMVIGSHTEAA